MSETFLFEDEERPAVYDHTIETCPEILHTETGRRYFCTREDGHLGPHEAQGYPNCVYARWF